MNSHPQLAIPPETHFIPLATRTCRSTDETHCLFNAIRQSKNWASFGLQEDELRARIDKEACSGVGLGIEAFYTLYAERNGKSRWGDKTPAYHAHMHLKEEIFPDARFIHVIRDGRDVALSVLKMWEKSGVRGANKGSFEDALRWWAARLDRARAESRSVQHYIEVRYEDLVLDTGPALRRISEFIELPWDESLVTFDGGGSSTRPDEERLGRWRTALDPSELTIRSESARSLLSELGYL